MFKIDGVEYDVFVTNLKRSFTVLDGENAGRTVDGSMHRDIIGTYYNYTLELDTKLLSTRDYANLYETISSPVPSHQVEFPYNNTTLSFNAYVAKGDDTVKIINGRQLWNGLSINFIAMDPQRRG